jgi:SAM-dependent methyltransferase
VLDLRALNGVCTLPRVSMQLRSTGLKRVLRRVARPFTSPIDGRVADINRRVDGARASAEHQGAELDQRIDQLHQRIGRLDKGTDEVSEALNLQSRSLDAYARSSAETSSYVGVELRRLHDGLDGLEQSVRELHEASFEHYYEARLAHARDLPLASLDEPLAQAINYASGHTGFAAQAGLWFNPPVAVALGAGVAVPATVNERIVEIPFAMAALGRVDPPARILDVGSAESTFPLSAASLGYQVTAIDPRRLQYSHPNLESFAGLLEDWTVPAEPFAAAFLISTVEHVGLGAYGEGAYGNPDHGKGADLALLQRIKRLLAPDGFMVLTTPFGERAVTDLERIYDEESLDELLSGWEILEQRMVVRRDSLIWEADEKLNPGERAVVMLAASPKQRG